MIIQTFTVDVQVLGVNMEGFVPKLVHEPLVIDHLQDEMRRIEIEPEIIIGQFSIASFTPRSFANFTIGGQILAYVNHKAAACQARQP